MHDVLNQILLLSRRKFKLHSFLIWRRDLKENDTSRYPTFSENPNCEGIPYASNKTWTKNILSKLESEEKFKELVNAYEDIIESFYLSW